MGRGGALSPELTVRQPLTAERLCELADRGLSQTEIATETGYSRQRVNSACRQYGIEPTKKPWHPPIEHQKLATAGRLVRGEAHIEAIRQCAADGMTATQAAVKLGVTRAAVYSATRRHKIAFSAKAPPLTLDRALQRKRELAVQRRAARRASGMCAKCGEQPPVDDKALCAACAQIESDRWHRGQQGPKSRGEPTKPPKAAKPPLPGTRRLSLPPCAICGHKMSVSSAAAQVRLHPGITVYPRCRACDQRIAQSVQGIRSARAARQDGEGEA